MLFLFSAGIAIQRHLIGAANYGNFIIFRNSFFHLINYQDLYLKYSHEYRDYFLYSPTFAVLMAPFALLPIFPSMILWSVLNGICIFFAIKMLPFDVRKKFFLFLIIFMEFNTSLTNMQTNTLVVSFLIFTFAFLERKNNFLAALFLVLTFYIKIYGIFAGIFFLMYPDKIKFILSTIFWMLLLFLLPLIFISFKHLSFLYQSWFYLTTAFQADQTGVSLIGILKTWFHFQPPTLWIELFGTFILVLPFFKKKFFKNAHFRIFWLASFLIWSVIFNHMAESPSYIIALFGVGIWYLAVTPKKTEMILLGFVLILTCLASSDAVPLSVRMHVILPYSLKALPCVAVWLYIQYRLLFWKQSA
ncbi:MAG: glycosyltransferase family 87 protein [Bacteroidia bacterium]